MLAEEICDSKLSLSELTSPVKLYPQYTKNIRVKDKGAVIKDKDVQDSLAEVEKLIAGKGRALLRQSGTEPVIRVMIESEKEEKCIEYAQIIVYTILKNGHGAE
jgi:phosphoglucosamine mutase